MRSWRGRRRAHLRRSAPARHDKTVQVWQPLVAVLGIAYLTEVIVQALRVYRVP